MAGTGADAALGALIDTLERRAERTAAAVDRAREMQRLRELGYAWREVLSTESRPLLSDTLFREAAVLDEVIGRLRREEAIALQDEGASRAEIADLFGLSVEHIDAMLDDRAAGP